jgi:hypothetical protein
MLNVDGEARDKHALVDDRLKRAFEIMLYSKLLGLFRYYLREYEEGLASGKIVQLAYFKTALKRILEAHYKKVSDRFVKTVVSRVGIPKDHKDILNSIGTKIDIHNQLRAEDSAEIISRTTEDDAHRAWSKAEVILLAAGAGTIITRSKIVAQAVLELHKQIRGRLNTISATETQNPAEYSKQTELLFLDYHGATINGIDLSDRNLSKEWNAVMDNRTRDAHAAAHGQIVSFGDSFDVGGERLMFPGDMSLGATIRNTINCRCTLVPIIN